MDEKFFIDWRHEMVEAIRELRRDGAEQSARVDIRLAAIESQVNAGRYDIERHTYQITEMNNLMTEVDGRVDGLEKREVQDSMRRIHLLESAHERREERERLEAEMRSKQDDAGKSSLGRAVLTTVVCTAAGSVVTGILAALWWLLALYITSTGAKP